MNQTILFTPVGGTDPISSTNCRDGSMLHICRIYKPDKVIMYMTKEMLAYQDKVLIERVEQEKHLVELVQNLRFVEENIRNLAAHEIMSVTEDTLQKMTGFSGNKIMNMIKELFHYTGLNIKKEYWDSYDKMNQMILERI